jgi:hypothetical protein
MGDLNSPLSSTERTSSQKINKDILELNNTTEEMNLKVIHIVFHPPEVDYTFFLSSNGTFSKINNTLRQITTNAKKIEILFCILTYYNGIKLEINGRENHKIIQIHED